MKDFKKFKFNYKQSVTWGDQDAFGHVNNVQVVRYFENARAEYFTVNKIWEDFGNKIKKGMVITNLNINYRKQIQYPTELNIYLGITNPDESIEIRIQTNIDNAFTHLGVALYNPSQTEVITGEDLGIEYYSGVDDGESWSEGSNSESIYWKLKNPGTYQLIVTAFDGDTPPEFTSIQLEIYKNAIRVWPFLVLSILWIVLAVLLFIRNSLSTPSKNNLSEDT